MLPSPGTSPSPCVLLVHRDSDWLLKMRQVLKNAGFRVFPARGIGEALDYLRQGGPADVAVVTTSPKEKASDEKALRDARPGLAVWISADLSIDPSRLVEEISKIVDSRHATVES